VQIHPTRESSDLAFAGMGVVLGGLLIQSGPVVAWGGALVLGLSVARALTRLGVSRVRAAGLEMLWRGDARRVTVARGQELVLQAELRNRHSSPVRFRGLRAVAAPELSVQVTPEADEVPANTRLAVTVTVKGLRVGRHGIHGLSLEVESGPSLFEVPLTFANPFGVEVMPTPYSVLVRSARGGRSRQQADEGRPGRLRGEGGELRELREHQSGDPFRRIAWKASARRGVLLVREYERDERDVVWLVLDAAVDHWSGPPGEAALDRAIDEVASVALRHGKAGDRVGLAIVGTRTLCFEKPDRGVAHAARLVEKLVHVTGCLDADRSGLDEQELALRVIEHMRPLDPALSAHVHASELDRIARRAEKLRQRAPFPEVVTQAASPRERSLRRYLAAFGISSPGRVDPERVRVDMELIRLLERLKQQRVRPSLIYMWSDAPDETSRPALTRALAERKRRGLTWKWLLLKPSFGNLADESPKARAARDAFVIRQRLAQERGERCLSRLGIRLERLSGATRGEALSPPSSGPAERAASEPLWEPAPRRSP
jgi:uncharacterized protein (DUF58 family)